MHNSQLVWHLQQKYYKSNSWLIRTGILLYLFTRIKINMQYIINSKNTSYKWQWWFLQCCLKKISSYCLNKTCEGADKQQDSCTRNPSLAFIHTHQHLQVYHHSLSRETLVKAPWVGKSNCAWYTYLSNVQVN